jgi:aspartate/glutamate racemase
MKKDIFFGVVGNMGPEADEYFQRCIRQEMHLQKDQDALPLVISKKPCHSRQNRRYP